MKELQLKKILSDFAYKIPTLVYKVKVKTMEGITQSKQVPYFHCGLFINSGTLR